MANGASSAILLRGTVSSTATGRIGNTARVDSITPDPVSENTRSYAEVRVADATAPSADLTVTNQADQTSARPGGTLTYTVTVRNNGPEPANSVVLTDNMPAVLANVQYTTDNGTSWQAWNGSLALGTLNNGESVTVMIRGTVSSSATGVISNTAVVESVTADPATGNNSASVQTAVAAAAVPAADLAVTKNVNQTTVFPGGTLTYTVAVTNNGPEPAEAVILTDNMPATLTAAEYSADNGTSWRTWNGSLALGTMAKGASSVFLLRGTVSSSATGVIANTATVESATADPATGNNSASAQTAVGAAAISGSRLILTKTAYPYTATPSCRISFKISIANPGTTEAAGVILTDPMPDEIRRVCYSADCGRTWRRWPGSLSVGNIPAGKNRTILLRGTVSCLAAQSIGTLTEVSYTLSGTGSLREQAAYNIPVTARL
jgi:uncharacterized repeat protein (TIGR01451 family)